MRPRLLHHGLSDDSLALIERQIRFGITPMPVHVLLVDDDTNLPMVGCGGGLGEWVTGDPAQVTCPGCLELVHA